MRKTEENSRNLIVDFFLTFSLNKDPERSVIFCIYKACYPESYRSALHVDYVRKFNGLQTKPILEMGTSLMRPRRDATPCSTSTVCGSI